MAGKRPEVNTEEFIRSRLEQQLREQYELHGWAIAIAASNPLDTLILLEEENQDIEYNGNSTNTTETKRAIS